MDDLERELRGLHAPFANPRTARDVLELAVARRRRTRRLATGLAAAAGLVLVALSTRAAPDPTVRERGATADPWVHLQAAAEGPDGVRPLGAAATLDPDEAVVFRVETNRRGDLQLVDDEGAPIWPPAGRSWSVEAGEHYIGDDTPLSWTPDTDPTRERRVTATFCVDERCVVCR
ncbi:MAG: hypothetical protein AAF602_27690 [Myxococcota bacterium]